MADTLFLSLIGRSHDAEKLVEVSQAENAAPADFLGQLTDLCLEIRTLANDVWQSRLNELHAGKVDGLEAKGNLYRAVFRRSVGALEYLIAETKQSDQKNPAVDVLTDALIDLRRIEKELSEKWPWLDEKTLQASFASCNRGDYHSTLEFLDGLHRSADSGS